MSSLVLSAFPAAYAWQVYGWKLGVGTFAAMAILLSATQWTFLLRKWPLRWLLRARIGLVVLGMAAIGISAAERCNFEMTACHRMFWPN